MNNADDMKSKIVLVAGETGAAGEGLVRKFLAAGARVVVPSRSAENISKMRRRINDTPEKTRLGGLLTLEQNIGTEDGAARVRDEILQRFGRLDAVIARDGGGRRGLPLITTPLEIWNETLHDNLTAQFIVAKNFLPVLLHQNCGSYVFMAETDGKTPVGKLIPNCVAAAGKIMLAQGLMLENSNNNVRIEILLTESPSSPVAAAGRIRADDLNEFIVELVCADSEIARNTEPILLLHRQQLDYALKKLNRR